MKCGCVKFLHKDKEWKNHAQDFGHHI